jgi:hypothetical protein
MLAGVMFIFGTEIIGGLSLRSESVYGLLPFCKHITTSELRYDCIKKILLTICVKYNKLKKLDMFNGSPLVIAPCVALFPVSMQL